MSQYRVTMKIDFLVSIDDDNSLADSRIPLQGDTPKAAVNRANWCWLHGMGLANQTCRTLGVKRSFVKNEDIDVVLLDSV